MNTGLEPDGRTPGFPLMFKRRHHSDRPDSPKADAAAGEDKTFDKAPGAADGGVAASRPQWPDDDKDDFSGSRLNTPPASLGFTPRPPD